MEHNRLTIEESRDVRAQFPILNQKVNREPLIYFDNAATSQTPDCVLEQLVAYYHHDNANIHRGVHTLAERSTNAYENSRQKIAKWLNAPSPNDIIFTNGTTSGLNFIASGLVRPQLEEGDVILTTRLEHHSNLVPWQEICQQTGALLCYVTLTENNQVDIARLRSLTEAESRKIKAIVIQHVSNVLGVSQPIAEISAWAHQHGILVIVDGAQAVPHQNIDVTAMDVDAYCFSGHKMYGPTGIGVCYLNQKWQEQTRPVQFGGEMIHYVGDYTSDYKQSPWKFEAGTQPIAQAIALSTALNFMNSIGMERIQSHEEALAHRLYKGLREIEGITCYQTEEMVATGTHGIVSFNFDHIHPHDAASAYDMEGIAVRAGHHCAQVLMRELGVSATLRASLSIYNTMEEVEQFLVSTQRIKEFFDHVTL